MTCRHICRWIAFFFFSCCYPNDLVIEDEEYEQNKIWITIVLQLAYLTFLCACIPFVFFWLPLYPEWLPVRIFLLVSAVCSLSACIIYFKTGKAKPMYWSLSLYGMLFPYTAWLCQRQYMATEAICWNWLTLSIVLMLLLASSRGAFWLLLLQIVTPIAGALTDTYLGFGLDIRWLIIRVICIVIPSCTLFFLLLFFSQLLNCSRKQALLRQELGQSILRNILPMPIADQLMDDLAQSCRIHIAHDYAMATVAFCDIVGFTQLCLTVESNCLVDTLNDIFTYFDRICLIHGVEKIKTIGDAYMFAGFPTTEEDPKEAAVAVVQVAARMVHHMDNFFVKGVESKTRLQIRAGVNSGPVVAGVIGCTKFAYDIWGPTVNMASRLESSGLPNEIQVSTATKDLIQDAIACKYREKLNLKGAGLHDTYLVELSEFSPPAEESPEMLEGLGLRDMAYLVQEINRRQATYTFSPRSAVLPFTPITAIISPRAAACPGRHCPLVAETHRRRSVVPDTGERLTSPKPADISRADRVQRLLQAMENSAGAVSMSESHFSSEGKDTLVHVGSSMLRAPGSNIFTIGNDKVFSPKGFSDDSLDKSEGRKGVNTSSSRRLAADQSLTINIPFLNVNGPIQDECHAQSSSTPARQDSPLPMASHMIAIESATTLSVAPPPDIADDSWDVQATAAVTEQASPLVSPAVFNLRSIPRAFSQTVGDDQKSVFSTKSWHSLPREESCSSDAANKNKYNPLTPDSPLKPLQPSPHLLRALQPSQSNGSLLLSQPVGSQAGPPRSPCNLMCVPPTLPRYPKPPDRPMSENPRHASSRSSFDSTATPDSWKDKLLPPYLRKTSLCPSPGHTSASSL